MHEDDPAAEYTTIEGVPYVRLVEDFGNSPVWAWEPVDYAELELSEDLERRMRAWAEACSEAGLTDGNGVAERSAQRLRAEAILLAQLLAEHLGSPLAVELPQAGTASWEDGGAAEWKDDDGPTPRRSLADPEMFHVDTFPARPAATRRVLWMLRHPFEVRGLEEGLGEWEA